MTAMTDGDQKATMEAVRRELSAVTLGDGVRAGGLTIFPLKLPGDRSQVPYVLLQKALRIGTARVDEISDSGNVPTLRFHNGGDQPVLLTEGEVLVGGKQNRVVNSTILAAGRASYDIPVSCVERGRWNRTQSGFSKGNTAPSSLRSRKIERYFQSAVKREERSENQGEVWASVDQTLHQTAVRSGTSSLSDAYRELDEELSERVQSVPRIRDARGVVVCAGERVIALELFDSEESFDER